MVTFCRAEPKMRIHVPHQVKVVRGVCLKIRQVKRRYQHDHHLRQRIGDRPEGAAQNVQVNGNREQDRDVRHDQHDDQLVHGELDAMAALLRLRHADDTNPPLLDAEVVVDALQARGRRAKEHD